jgi:hypothetical protein
MCFTLNEAICRDNVDYRYNQNGIWDCGWVREDIDSRCNLTDHNNHLIADECQVTCETCDRRLEVVKKSVGQYCDTESDCSSGVCKENTCYQSHDCMTLKQQPGQEFDKNQILLVFVPSGFTDLSEWRRQVAKTFWVYKDFEFFSFTNHRYNAFYVEDLSESSDGFCNFNCEGVKTLLCCDVERARSLSSKCFPPGATTQTVVIHNDERYGGGGYRQQNLATTSVHDLGPEISIHELGHSLFELGDEYTDSFFSAEDSANCDVEGCPKWSDLNEHLGGGLCEIKGCEGGNYYVGEPSFMQYLSNPFGEVNTRFTCCTYLALTGSFPSYCDRFEFGDGLEAYCKKDYQNYGTYSTEQINYRNEGGKYVLIKNPAILTLDLQRETFRYDSPASGTGPRLIRRKSYFGDYINLSSALNAGVRNVQKLTIWFDSGEKEINYYDSREYIDVPPSEGENATNIASAASIIELAVNAEMGVVVDIQFSDVHIGYSALFSIWLSNLYKPIRYILFGENDNKFYIGK